MALKITKVPAAPATGKSAASKKAKKPSAGSPALEHALTHLLAADPVFSGAAKIFVGDVQVAEASHVSVELHKPKLVAQTPVQALADELIDLNLKLKAAHIDEINKRITEIKAELQDYGKNYPTSEGFVIEGTLGLVELSKCADQTVISDLDGLIKYAEEKVGHEAIMATMKPGLGDLKKVLSENEIEKFAEHKTGSRTCKVKPFAG